MGETKKRRGTILKIGSDPEFVFYKNNHFVYADDAQRGFRIRENSRIGRDGVQSIGELRPTASSDPIKHFNNILKLILKLEEKFPGYEIRAGSSGGAYWNLGGHLHLDNLKSEQCKTLDFYLAIPVVFIEQEPYSSMRHSAHSLSDSRFERKNRGEYRTLSSWLVDPFICQGILCLAFTIMNEIDNLNPGRFPRRFMELFKRGEFFHFENNLKAAIEKIPKLILYKDFKEEIDFLLRLLESKKTWNELQNIIPLWKNWEVDLKKYNKNPKKFILNRRRYLNR